MEIISRDLQPLQILFVSLTALVSYDPGQWAMWLEKALLLQLSSTLNCSFAILATLVINMMMWCLYFPCKQQQSPVSSYLPFNATTEDYTLQFPDI